MDRLLLPREDYQKLRARIQEFYPVLEVIQHIEHVGGQSFLVGGAVRDLIMGLPIKDLDIEVHNLSLDQLSNVMGAFGHVNYVGKSFGVLRLEGLPVDWSLPRTDQAGRKPDVTLDPAMTIEEALRRRDLTMNAMAIDLMSYELIDPFNGVQDIQEHVMRTPDPYFFIHDPLRFFRVMQFISRFALCPDTELNRVCKQMDITHISRERIEMEFNKLMLLSKQPSLGIRWLEHLGRLSEILPELAATRAVPQDPSWHPEGDVFEHTMQALDAAAQENYDSDRQKIIITYAALCHDLGKVVTTRFIKGRWRAYGHDRAGVPLTRAMLKRITHDRELIDSVSLLVEYHMVPFEWVKSNARPAAYKRLAYTLSPYVTLGMLARLACADKRGRNPELGHPLITPCPEVEEFVRRAEAAGVLHQPEHPVLQGRDLLDSVPSGPELGRLVKEAYNIQIAQNIHDKGELKLRVLKLFK